MTLTETSARHRRRLLRLSAGVCGLMLLAVLGGCGIGDAFRSGPVFSMEWVALQASPDTNNDQPVAVDLVILHQEELIERLEKLPASDWFDRKAQFARDFPKGFTIISWELVPDQSIQARQLTDEELESETGDRAVGAYVFALYSTPGDHRARVLTQRGITIVLEEDTFFLQPYEPSS
ncbi:MAG: hypothetical protein RIM72_16715 [Alphaproteobacteria bacterium]